MLVRGGNGKCEALIGSAPADLIVISFQNEETHERG